MMLSTHSPMNLLREMSRAAMFHHDLMWAHPASLFGSTFDPFPFYSPLHQLIMLDKARVASTATTDSAAKDAQPPSAAKQQQHKAIADTPSTKLLSTAYNTDFPLSSPLDLLRLMTTTPDISPLSFWRPSCDVAVHEGQVVITADLPGVKEEDVSVEVDDHAHVLRITGTRSSTVKKSKKEQQQPSDTTTTAAIDAPPGASMAQVAPIGVASHPVSANDWGFTERAFGSFQRTFALPPSLDKSAVKASFANGVLTVTYPQVQEQARQEPRKIPIDFKPPTTDTQQSPAAAAVEATEPIKADDNTSATATATTATVSGDASFAAKMKRRARAMQQRADEDPIASFLDLELDDDAVRI